MQGARMSDFAARRKAKKLVACVQGLLGTWCFTKDAWCLRAGPEVCCTL